MWGSDTFLPGDMSDTAFRVKHDTALLDEIGVSDAEKQRIMSGTADELFPRAR